MKFQPPKNDRRFIPKAKKQPVGESAEDESLEALPSHLQKSAQESPAQTAMPPKAKGKKPPLPAAKPDPTVRPRRKIAPGLKLAIDRLAKK